MQNIIDLGIPSVYGAATAAFDPIYRKTAYPWVGEQAIYPKSAWEVKKERELLMLAQPERIKSDLEFKQIMLNLWKEHHVDRINSLAQAKDLLWHGFADDALLASLSAGVPVPAECVATEVLDDRMRGAAADLVLSRLVNKGFEYLEGPTGLKYKKVRDDLFIHRDLARRAALAGAVDVGGVIPSAFGVGAGIPSVATGFPYALGPKAFEVCTSVCPAYSTSPSVFGRSGVVCHRI